jgi:hypothetical protein
LLVHLYSQEQADSLCLWLARHASSIHYLELATDPSLYTRQLMAWREMAHMAIAAAAGSGPIPFPRVRFCLCEGACLRGKGGGGGGREEGRVERGGEGGGREGGLMALREAAHMAILGAEGGGWEGRGENLAGWAYACIHAHVCVGGGGRTDPSLYTRQLMAWREMAHVAIAAAAGSGPIPFPRVRLGVSE